MDAPKTASAAVEPGRGKGPDVHAVRAGQGLGHDRLGAPVAHAMLLLEHDLLLNASGRIAAYDEGLPVRHRPALPGRSQP